jgi:hypothetical protein
VTRGVVAAATLERKAIAAIVSGVRVIAIVPISFCHCCVESKKRTIHRVKYWEIIADNLSKAGWSWGCIIQLKDYL